MSDFKAKKAPDSISAGALPHTPIGKLAVLPKLPADSITALGPPDLETACLPKSINPPMHWQIAADVVRCQRQAEHHPPGTEELAQTATFTSNSRV